MRVEFLGDDVVGMVLIDSSHEQQGHRLPEIDAILDALAAIPGVYVPSRYALERDEAGRLRLLVTVDLAHDSRPTVLARIRSKSMSAPRPGRSIAWTWPSTISISGFRPYFWAPAGSSTSKNSVFGIAIAT